MAVKVNGKDMKDAVIKTDQYEMKILEFMPDHMKASVKGTAGESFNFVPRFISVVYPDKAIDAKDTGITVVGPGKTVESLIEFQEKLRIERFISMDLRYARKKLATIMIE